MVAGVAACAVCGAGPILGFLAALGIGAVAGAFVFGLVGLLSVAAIGAFLVLRRRRQQSFCATPPEGQSDTIGPQRLPT